MSTLLASLAAAVAIAVEFLLYIWLIPPKVTWDPVSLWRQGSLGKVFVMGAVAVPLLIPLVVFGLVFSYRDRRVAFHADTAESAKR